LDPRNLISQIDNLQDIGADQYGMLSDLSEKYPWFAAVHILQAKCLSNQNKYGFKQALKKAAIYTGDREVLYDVIHASTSLEEESSIPISSDKVLEEENPIQVIEEIDAPSVVTLKDDNPILAEDIEEDVAELSREEISEDVPEPKQNEEIESGIPTSVYDPLVELKKMIVEPDESDPQEKYNPLILVPEPEAIEIEAKKSVAEKHDFLAWLDEFKETKEEQKEKIPRSLPMSEEAKTLLDNFINNRPSSKRMKKGFFDPETYAKNSEEEESDVVTESLADLFIKQELPLKAIGVYTKLQLQNPQKFSYFAALIEKVKTNFNLT
jgi:hypothetical protein